MNTQEENILIAEFMGCKNPEYVQIQYDKKWDWIMPVARKIFHLERMNSKKELVNRIERIKRVLEDVDIRVLHNRVYLFIKWYNEVEK